MRWITVEQILRVIEVVVKSFKKGDRIDHIYQLAVHQVAKEYDVTYQTIGDACRRRLGLDTVGDFKRMLEAAALEGDYSDLQNLLLSKPPHAYHERINKFFSTLKNGNTTTEVPSIDTYVNYNVRLRKSDSNVLEVLAQLLGEKPEKILAETAMKAVKERLRKVVDHL